MSSLTEDFFAYVWAIHRIADRYDEKGESRRGMQAISFSHALAELRQGAYDELFPYEVSRSRPHAKRKKSGKREPGKPELGYGSWRGAAWYTPVALDGVKRPVAPIPPLVTRIIQPGKNLFNSKKNLVVALNRFLKTPLFIQLQKRELALAELLKRNAEDVVAFEETFGRSVDRLIYRGPVVVAGDRRDHTRQGHEEEPLVWLGVLPEDVIDLTEFKNLLSKEPLRLLLVRRALQLFEPFPKDELPRPSWKQRPVLQAYARFCGADVKSMGDWEHAEGDFASGHRAYAFWFPEKVTAHSFAELPTGAEVVWGGSEGLTPMLKKLGSAEPHRGPAPLHLFSSEMGASLWHDMPWLWHRREGDGVIRPGTNDEALAAVALMYASSALHFLRIRASADLVRRAARLLCDLPLEPGEQVLIAAKLIDPSRAGMVPNGGPPVRQDAMVAHEVCARALDVIFWWVWREAPLDHPEYDRRDAFLEYTSGDAQLREELGKEWRERFAGSYEVLWTDFTAAMAQNEYEGAADLALRLLPRGRDMVDVTWRNRFGALQVDGTTEELLRAARAAIRSSTGVSSAVDALLRRKAEPPVHAFLEEIRPLLKPGYLVRSQVDQALGQDDQG
jgi:hypothetical protein